MKLRKCLLILPTAIALASSAGAIQINWGCDVDSVLRDSFGVALDETFAVQLGYFQSVLGVPFVPSASNANDWSSHWKVFDHASTDQATYDPDSGYFTSSALLKSDGSSDGAAADLGVDFSNQKAYVWIHNSETAAPGSEWFLASAPAWQLPAKVDSCCDNRAPLEWSISDLTPSDVPVYGKQGNVTGAGAYTNTGNYALQTFTFVPEPSSSLLLALGGAGHHAAPPSHQILIRPMAPRPHWLLLFFLWLAGVECRAETISWYSVAGAINQTSAGTPMRGAFNFELGVFTGSFVPTASNMAQWAANWMPAQRIAYSEANQRFDGLFTVEDNIAPFSVGKAAYVWGFQAGVNASEWILLRKNDWTWPAPNPVGNPIDGPDWKAAAATAVLGSIDADGSPFLMKSAAVTDAASPLTSWQQWQDAELAGEVLNGPNDDADHDGTSNLLEFVFGTQPKQAGAAPAMPSEIVSVSSQQLLQITIPRRIDHPAALTMQVPPDLTTWASGPAVTAEVSSTQAPWVVRDLTPLGPSQRQRFLRLKSELVAP